MRTTWCTAAGLAACLASIAGAANVYVLSSGDAAIDAAVVAALTSRGHTATVGVMFGQFDGTQSLSGYQTVYIQANYNWAISAAMPAAGQQALVDWVNGGGRLVTCEWMVWLCASQSTLYPSLPAILPLSPDVSYGTTSTATYRVGTADAAVNAGLPDSFTFPLTSYAGTETYTAARPGATALYTSDSAAGAVGLAGWAQGAGYVFSFSTTNGPEQVADPNFGRLLGNVMGAAASGCYVNCDGSTAAPILNINDFQCFLNQFALGQPYANCDNSSVPPVLNVNDFQCFVNKYAIGCN